jgi:hypothetical protein
LDLSAILGRITKVSGAIKCDDTFCTNLQKIGDGGDVRPSSHLFFPGGFWLLLSIVVGDAMAVLTTSKKSVDKTQRSSSGYPWPFHTYYIYITKTLLLLQFEMARDQRAGWDSFGSAHDCRSLFVLFGAGLLWWFCIHH